MTYPHNFEQKIGFDKIRQLLIDKCLSPLGKELTQNMEFSTNINSIKKNLNLTEEFTRILSNEDNFPDNNFFDVRTPLNKIHVEGTFLDESELFDLKRSLETIQDIINFFNTEESEESIYPHLKSECQDIITFPFLIKRIDQILDKFGRIKDNASPTLLTIRKNITSTINSISRSLGNILRDAQKEGYIDKDTTPTMRDGRLVIPVNPSNKRKIKGIIHDESASGKTVFIEPAQVVEANNRIRELESEERREIMRILVEFSDLIRPHIEDILFSFKFLASIDFIRAKALFGISTNSEMPLVEDTCQAIWTGAIHPLLFLSLQKQQKKVVSLEIELDEKQRIILISGPNAGGKSVCLKTMGLLQYMLQCGMLIPLHSTSRCGIFESIYIDIGDEQSIENDLSTYSSHLTNMKYFVRNCNSKTLILIDEFGGGTEPSIGGAIAQALLDRFNQNKAYGVITTHYQNLKHFAEDTPGIVNGAMLYDRHLMQPLFKLSVGNPGSSFVIEIARKIGLPEDVIEEASQIVGSDYIDMDKYLQDIVRDKRYWENKRKNIRLQEKKLEESSSKYEAQLIELAQQKKEIIKQAKVNAEQILAQANTRIENTIKEIKEAQAEKEKTRSIRKDLDEFKQSLADDSLFEDKISRKIEKIKQRKQNKEAQQNKSKKEVFKPEIIEVKDAVRIKGQTSIGEVIQINGNNVIVAFGMIKTTVKVENLEKMSKNQIKREQPKATYLTTQTTDEIRERKLNFKQDIDVRGMRGEEALQAVTYFIDDAILVGMARVRILHGTGTGALRQIIRQYLSTINGVHSFRDEHVQFGGAGITVVDLD